MLWVARMEACSCPSFCTENYLFNLFAQESSSALQSDAAPVSTLQHFIQVLSSSGFWSSLHPGPVCPYTSTTADSDGMEEKSKGELGARTCFGYSEPQVRRAAWALVANIVDPKRGTCLVLAYGLMYSLLLCVLCMTFRGIAAWYSASLVLCCLTFSVGRDGCGSAGCPCQAVINTPERCVPSLDCIYLTCSGDTANTFLNRLSPSMVN